MRTILSILAASALALVACGSSESSSGTTGGASTSTSSGAGGAIDPGSTSSTGSGNGMVCAAGTLCLQVKQVDAGGAVASGRVAVVWYPFDDANTTPPLVAYDAPFDPATKRIDIPYQALAPVTDALMLCTRSCMDPATCPCMGDPALGFAAVGVGQDLNQDGKLDAAEFESTLYGSGRLAVVYSQKAYHPSPASVAAILPEGINVGTHAYRIIAKSGGSPFDQLGIAFDGTVFDLDVCSGAPGCKVPTPNLH
ncbi:MAG: hypothetical protein ABJE95_25635 [Byssovorax sp.]